MSSFMKPTKSSQMRNDDQKKLVKQGVPQKIIKPIERGRRSFQGRGSVASIDNQNYLDTETTQELRNSEVFNTRNSILQQQKSQQSMQSKGTPQKQLLESFGQQRPSTTQAKTPRIESKDKQMDLDKQRALTSRLSQPKILNKGASQTNIGAKNDKLNSSQNKTVKPLLSGRNSVVNAQTKSQLMRKQTIESEREKSSRQNSVASGSSLNNSLKNRQLQSSIRLSQNRQSLRNQNASQASNKQSNILDKENIKTHSRTKSALELKLEQIKLKSNERFFQNTPSGKQLNSRQITKTPEPKVIGKKEVTTKPIQSAKKVVTKGSSKQAINTQLQQTFGSKLQKVEVDDKKAAADQPMNSQAAQQNLDKTENTSQFITLQSLAESTIIDNDGFQTAIMSSLLDNNEMDDAENSNGIGNSNIIGEEADFQLEGLSVHEDDPLTLDGMSKDDCFTLDAQSSVSPSKQEQSDTGEFTIGKIRRNKHDRQISLPEFTNNDGDSIIHVNVLDVSKESTGDIQAKNIFNLNQTGSQEDGIASEAQITAVLGDSFNDSSMNENDMIKVDLMDKIRERSKQLQIQIDEEDEENEHDNSYFFEKQVQPINSKKSAHSKTFNYEEQLGEQCQLTARKQPSKDKMELDNIKVENNQYFNEEEQESLQKVAVIEESSESEDIVTVQNEQSSTQKKKENSPKKKESQTHLIMEFDEITANFEVESQKGHDQQVFLAGSFAQFANQSIVENQMKIQKQNSVDIEKLSEDESSPKNLKINTKKRDSSIKRPAQRVDFSFQIEGSPERSMKILNTLSSAKQNRSRESSVHKNERSQTKAFNSELFVVQEASEGPTPRNQNNLKFQFQNSSSDKSSSFKKCIQSISPIKSIREEDSDEKSQQVVHFRQNSEDIKKENESLPINFTNQKNRGSIVENEGLFKFLQNQYNESTVPFKGSMVEKDNVDQTQKENAQTAIEQPPQRNTYHVLGETQRMSLQEKIQLRKKKLQENQQGVTVDPSQFSSNFNNNNEQEEYQSPSFKPRQPTGRPKKFRFEDVVSDSNEKEDNESDDFSAPEGFEIKNNLTKVPIKMEKLDLNKLVNNKNNQRPIKSNQNSRGSNRYKKFTNEVSDEEDSKLRIESNSLYQRQNDSLSQNYKSTDLFRSSQDLSQLAKMVDNFVIQNNQNSRRGGNSTKSLEKSHKKIEKKPILITIDEDDNAEDGLNRYTHQPSLHVMKSGTVLTPKNNNQPKCETPKNLCNTQNQFSKKQKIQDNNILSPHSHTKPTSHLDKQSQFDDARSTYSRISKVSKYTNNMLNKSNNMINDQWYQFLYNYDDQILNDDEDDSVSITKSQGNISRFTLNSKLSNAAHSNMSKLSKLQNQFVYSKQQQNATTTVSQVNNNAGETAAAGAKRKDTVNERSPLCKLNELLDSIDICRFIRLNWLLGPMINQRTVKSRIFNFLHFQISQIVDKLECPIKRAICQYMADDLVDCVELCKQCRELYLQQYKVNRKNTKYDSYQMVKVWVIELTSYIEMMRDDQTTVEKRERIREQAHKVLELIPMVVKRRQQQHFTIIELILQYKEKIAYSKLKDLDFISYKLFKLERAISLQVESPQNGLKTAGDEISHLFVQEDEDEKKSPEEYCQEIQKQFNRISPQEYIKKIEYFMYGALCAFRNHHYQEAWNFVSQAPFICNFGEQVPDIETLVVFEMLKMVEIKLLTKIGRPEQAIIQLSNRFFRTRIIDDEQLNKLFPFSASQQNLMNFDTYIFLDQTWYLYKKIKYTCRLIEFKQDQLKFKMVSIIGQDFNQDANALQKANDELYNQIYHLIHIIKSLRYYENKQEYRNRIMQFHWLLVKLLLRLDKMGKFQQMISNDNFVGIFDKIDVMQIIQQLLVKWQPGVKGGGHEGQIAQVSKLKNKRLIEAFKYKYGEQPLSKTIQSIQNRLNQKFKKGNSVNYFNNLKRSSHKNKQLKKLKKFEESNIDMSMSQSNILGKSENEMLWRSFRDGSAINQISQCPRSTVHAEAENEMLGHLKKSPSQFFIQLQYIADFVDMKLNNINNAGLKDALKRQQNDCEQFAFEERGSLHKQEIKIKNYFELLKTDKHHRQTKYIAQGLQIFLSQIKMIVFQNLNTVQDIVDYDIKQANKNADQNPNKQDKNNKGKNFKSQFLEKSKKVLHAIETIYINDKLMNINPANSQLMNDMQKNPYISDEKSCITGQLGLSAFLNKGALNISQDSQAFNYSHIDNLTNFNFQQYGGGNKLQLDASDNISAKNYVTNSLNFRALQNYRADLTEKNSQFTESIDCQSASRFEGGEEESMGNVQINDLAVGLQRQFKPQNQRGQEEPRQNRGKYSQMRVETQFRQNDAAKQKRKHKSIMRKMKVQYFNQGEGSENDEETRSLFERKMELTARQVEKKSPDILNTPGLPQKNRNAMIDHQDQQRLLVQNQINYNQGKHQMQQQPNKKHLQTPNREEEDFVIELNRSIIERNQNDSISGDQNRNNTKSSTGGKLPKNTNNEELLVSANQKKNLSSSFKEDQQPDLDALYIRSPQMTALLGDLKFGGENASNNEQDGHSMMANQHGRLTFPVNLMHSNKKNEGNDLYLDLELINTTSQNNGPLGAHEIENFFDQTSKLAPSQINFNDLDIDIHRQSSPSRDTSDLDSDEDSDEDENCVSIDDLIVNQDEKLNYSILNHCIYDDEMLYKLLMACCLADNHLNLGIRIINILIKIREQQEFLKIKKSCFMNYLEIIMAYIYLRLNQKQFLKQQSNINTSRILEQNQNTSNRGLGVSNQDLSAFRIQELSRDDISQIGLNNTSNLQGVNGPGMTTLMDTLTNSITNHNNPQNYGFTTTDVSQGHISQHMIAPCHAALKQQIMCIIQNQDYFVQQARYHWKQFDADGFLVNMNFNDTDSEDSQMGPQKRLQTFNIMTMMFLYVQNELLTYKQLRTYDSMFEVCDVRRVRFSQSEGDESYQICCRKLPQEVKNQRMFSAYKKFDNRENILRKSDSHVESLKQKDMQMNQGSSYLTESQQQRQHQLQLQVQPDSVTKVNYNTLQNFGGAANDEINQQNNTNNNMQEFNLFKKGLANLNCNTNNYNTSPSPGGSKRNTLGFSGMRSTADFGLQQLMFQKQESQSKKEQSRRNTLEEVLDGEYSEDETIQLRIHKNN